MASGSYFQNFGIGGELLVLGLALVLVDKVVSLESVSCADDSRASKFSGCANRKALSFNLKSRFGSVCPSSQAPSAADLGRSHTGFSD